MTDIRDQMKHDKLLATQRNFALALDHIQNIPEKLLELASNIIKCSHSHRGLKERDLPDSATALTIPVSAARWNIEHNRLISTDDMLKMIMQKYVENGFGSPETFKSDFRVAYPNEYNQQKTAPSLTPEKIIAARRQSTYS